MRRLLVVAPRRCVDPRAGIRGKERSIRRRARGVKRTRLPSRPVFTGLVQGIGRVLERSPTAAVPAAPARDGGAPTVRLVIAPWPDGAAGAGAHAAPSDDRADRGGWWARIRTGDSVAVNGVCLTHVGAAASSGVPLSFDVIPQTMAMTTLGDLAGGDPVNLEPALRAADPIGGHLVQGHVDGVGVIRMIRQDADGVRFGVEVPEALRAYMVPQGSVCVDGVSLTIAAVPAEDLLEVALIPATLAGTTLGRRREGDRVNLESDMIARTVVAWLERGHRIDRAGRP